MKYTTTFTGQVDTVKQLELKSKIVLAGLGMENVRNYVCNLGLDEFLKDADMHIEVIKKSLEVK